MPLRPIGACLSIPQGIFPNGLARRPQVGYGRSHSGKRSGALLRSNSARDTRTQGASMTREACGHFSRRPHSSPSSNAWAMPGKPRGSGGRAPSNYQRAAEWRSRRRSRRTPVGLRRSLAGFLSPRETVCGIPAAPRAILVSVFLPKSVRPKGPLPSRQQFRILQFRVGLPDQPSEPRSC